ncbi:MAG TPA: hypothetical protein VGK24_11190 [Candidatus Angelobacter sp.]|jgi:hypothetical protein
MNFSSLLLRPAILLTGALLMYGAPAPAQQSIAGTVRNGTTSRPAVGDNVLLLRLSGKDGMLEESRTRSDARGSFRLPLYFPESAHVIRVLHGGVNYDRLFTSAGSVNLEVFDSGPKISGISGYATIVKLESNGAAYNITELHAIQNKSSPPRTQMSFKNLEVELPTKSALDSVTVIGPGSLAPVKIAARPAGPESYAIGFPLRPGITQYAVRYHLPYMNKVQFRSRVLYPTRQWSVVFPNTMTFVEHGSGKFRRIVDQNGVLVEAVKDAQPGALPVFEISGAGSLPPMRAEVAGQTNPMARPSAAATRPEGTQSVATRRQDGNVTVALALTTAFIAFLGCGVLLAVQRRSAKRRATLRRLKERLFELENARIRETISAEEYSRTKRIMDEMLIESIGAS